jgi:prophage antirepressor-like protein
MKRFFAIELEDYVEKEAEWWFVISDVVAALTNSTDPARYIRDLRYRDEELAVLMSPVGKGASEFATPLDLPFETAGGKQKLSCWNTEGIFTQLGEAATTRIARTDDAQGMDKNKNVL